MPDDIKPNPLAAAPVTGAAAANAAVAAKLADQDAAGHSMVGQPEDIQATGDALDALAAQVKPAEPPEKTPEEIAAAETAAKAAAEEAAKQAEAAKAAEETAKKADDYFKDSPSLPAGASPKSAEAFATIKLRAAQEIEAREKQILEFKQKLAELEEKSKTPPAELTQAQKELEDLRSWRAKLDVDFDPKFKEFDKTISATNEFIYDQLRKNPICTEAVIDEIKKHGGPANCNLTKVFEAMKDPVLQNLVQSKIADVVMQRYNKEQAIKAAKENIVQYTQQRQQEWQKVATAHTETTQKELNAMLSSLPWYAERKPADKAPEAEVKAATEHNKFLTDLKGQIAEAIKDDSPQMRAVLITGLAQLFNLQRVHAAANAELAQVKKELAEVSAKWEKVKAASVNRSRDSNASAAAAAAQKPAAPSFNVPAGDALDALAKQITEQRSAKGL